jgi:hypothetical protein
MITSFSRLKPSLIEGAGVGVFSIGFIPKGTDPFEGCTTQLRNTKMCYYRMVQDLSL